MKYAKWIAVVAAFVLSACEGTTYVSSVPNAAVNLRIYLDKGEFVHFGASDYVIIDNLGYHYHGVVAQQHTVSDYTGYAGVVVVNDFGRCYSYDMACPKCLSKKQPIEVESFMLAHCPICGEEFELNAGTGVPRRGIVKEPLRRYQTFYDGLTITITR